MKYILIFALIGLLFIVGCKPTIDLFNDFEQKGQENVQNIDEVRCSNILDPHSEGYFPQEMILNIFNNKAHSYDEGIKTGYCFDVEYIPQGDNQDFIDAFRFNKTGNYKETKFEINRLSERDLVRVYVDGEMVAEFVPPCANVFFRQIYINKTKDENWDCFFNKELKSTNNTYKQLDGQACDEYKIHCGG